MSASRSEPTITVGNVALSFHRAAAAVTRRVLEAHGHRVDSVEAPHEQLFRLQEEGGIDVLVSAWLPSSHDTSSPRYRDRVRVLTPHYRPYCVSAVQARPGEEQELRDARPRGGKPPGRRTVAVAYVPHQGAGTTVGLLVVHAGVAERGAPARRAPGQRSHLRRFAESHRR
ncbi:glycine betaine ABC transporter substrate-binding protein [Streptomyces canarius]